VGKSASGFIFSSPTNRQISEGGALLFYAGSDAVFFCNLPTTRQCVATEIMM